MKATADLLVEAGGSDVSTRAICERAGVSAPALYRFFKDKDALIAAVVTQAFEEYLAAKRRAETHDDATVDLRAGWDSHTQWALDNPAYYQLIFGSGPRETPAVTEGVRLLRAVLDRCAQQGQLAVPVETATQVVMAANVGVSLMLIRFPTIFSAADLSARLRDAVHDAVIVSASAPVDSVVPVAATTLLSQLDSEPAATFSKAETGLMKEWLARLTGI